MRHCKRKSKPFPSDSRKIRLLAFPTSPIPPPLPPNLRTPFTPRTMLCSWRMKRLLLALSCALSLCACAHATTPPVLDRYAPTFYGIELPDSGANVLLIIDASKSMWRKDASRTKAGTRWDTLCDEVRQMLETMRQANRLLHAPFSVSLLFEGGEGETMKAVTPYNPAQPEASARLLSTLANRQPLPGGSFEVTFGETLWALVARNHITHIFYLGDNDIAQHASTVRPAVEAWYALPEKNPTPAQRKLWQLKRKWYQPWQGWRAPRPGVPPSPNQKNLPPPPKDVSFSCVAIGQKSPLLKALSKTGHGQYVERTNPRSRSKPTPNP